MVQKIHCVDRRNADVRIVSSGDEVQRASAFVEAGTSGAAMDFNTNIKDIVAFKSAVGVLHKHKQSMLLAREKALREFVVAPPTTHGDRGVGITGSSGASA